MIKISPSLFGADISKIGAELQAVEAAGADMLHVDSMDGNFVPNIAFGPDQIKMIRPVTKLPFDVHLMIREPDRFIPRFVDAGADIITVHAEATTHLHRTLDLIKSFGIKAGVVLNPSTPVDVIKYVIDDVDMILQMTCDPGGGKGGFVEASYQKVRDIKALVGNRDIDIEVDGKINLEIAPKIVEAGANVIVVGAYAFTGDAKKNIEALRDVLK